MLTKKCIVCGTEYAKKTTCSLKEWDKSKYCSRKCINTGRTPYNKRNDMDTSCQNCGKHFRKRCFDDKYCSRKCSRAKQVISPESYIKAAETKKKNGYVHSPETREKLRQAFKGEKSHWWRGGVTEENYRLRRGSRFKTWRKAVFSRDNWTCQSCKIRGGVLHPHHIKPFATFPDLRFEVYNGITLCIECHKQTDNYGKHTT